MAHELVTGYQRELGPPRCAFKIDIKKAYDTLIGLICLICLMGLVSIRRWSSGLRN